MFLLLGARATTNGGKIEAVIGTEKTFRLSAEDHRMVKDSVGKTRRQLQVCCMLMGDTTPYRFHWPLHAELRINKVRAKGSCWQGGRTGGQGSLAGLHLLGDGGFL